MTLALIELVVTTLSLFQNDKNDDFCLKPPPPSFSDDVILFTIFWDGVPNICKMGGGVGQSPFFSQYSERLMYFHENIDGTVFSYLIIFGCFIILKDSGLHLKE